MAGGYTVPPDGDFGAIIARLQRIEERLREMERPSGSQTAESLRQLNNASESKSASSGFLTQNDITPPLTGYDTAVIVFDKPEWATRATILAAGSIYIAAPPAAGFGAPSRLRIDGVNGQAVPNFFVPRRSGVVDAMNAYTDQDAITTDAVRASVFARTFDVTGGTVQVGWRVDITDPWGSGDFLFADTVATVFWSAP